MLKYTEVKSLFFINVLRKIAREKLNTVESRLLEENKDHPEILNINCVDPLNRSALIAAIENENVELMRLLLDLGIQVKVINNNY